MEHSQLTGPAAALLRALAPLPENLFLDPVEYLRADHFRLEALATAVRDMVGLNGANHRLNPETAAPLAAFLESDLPRHLDDERVDLVPMLQSRLPDPSELESVFKILADGQSRQEHLAAQLASEVKRSEPTGTITNPRRFWQMAGAFHESLSWTADAETGLLFRLAGRLLSDADLVSFGRAMAARRAATYPEP